MSIVKLSDGGFRDLGVAVFGLSSCILAACAQAQPAPATKTNEQAPDQVQEYWTPERMKATKPMPLPTPSAPPGSNSAPPADDINKPGSAPPATDAQESNAVPPVDSTSQPAKPDAGAGRP